MSWTPERPLLLRIRDRQDRAAWNEFVALYTPLLYSYALKAGLQDADAADVAQEAMCDVVRTICRFQYDSAKGSFRGWLLTITRNQLRKRFRADKRQAIGSGDTAILSLLNEHPGPDDQQQWEHEYQVRLFHWAAEKVRGDFRPATWHVFWQTTVENVPIEAAATPTT